MVRSKPKVAPFNWLEDLHTWEDSFLEQDIINELSEDLPNKLTEEQAMQLVNTEEELW